MISAPGLAFAAAACGVLAAWDLAGSVDSAALVAAVQRLSAPWRSAGRGAPPGADAEERRRLALVLAGCALASGWLLSGPVAGVLGAVAAPRALRSLLARRRARHVAALVAGAPGVARAMADALSAGRSIRGALAEAAATSGSDAVAIELRVARRELELGAGTEDVLERLRARAGAPAWDTLTAAILLQRDAGGDLAGLLRSIATDLESARRAEADARAATAQARFTARLVAALPLAAIGLAELADPGTLAGIAGAPLSALLAGAAVVLQVFALWLVGRLARTGAGG